MHNGGFYLFDASARPTEFDFMELKEFVASRLHKGNFSASAWWRFLSNWITLLGG